MPQLLYLSITDIAVDLFKKHSREFSNDQKQFPQTTRILERKAYVIPSSNSPKVTKWQYRCYNDKLKLSQWASFRGQFFIKRSFVVYDI